MASEGLTTSEELSGAVRAERERLASVLHAGIVQQVTALSLAVDSALLHAADGNGDRLGEALRRARRIADLAITDCRALLDDLCQPTVSADP